MATRSSTLALVALSSCGTARRAPSSSVEHAAQVSSRVAARATDAEAPASAIAERPLVWLEPPSSGELVRWTLHNDGDRALRFEERAWRGLVLEYLDPQRRWRPMFSMRERHARAPSLPSPPEVAPHATLELQTAGSPPALPSDHYRVVLRYVTELPETRWEIHTRFRVSRMTAEQTATARSALASLGEACASEVFDPAARFLFRAGSEETLAVRDGLGAPFGDRDARFRMLTFGLRANYLAPLLSSADRELAFAAAIHLTEGVEQQLLRRDEAFHEAGAVLVRALLDPATSASREADIVRSLGAHTVEPAPYLEALQGWLERETSCLLRDRAAARLVALSVYGTQEQRESVARGLLRVGARLHDRQGAHLQALARSMLPHGPGAPLAVPLPHCPDERAPPPVRVSLPAGPVFAPMEARCVAPFEAAYRLLPLSESAPSVALEGHAIERL